MADLHTLSGLSAYTGSLCGSNVKALGISPAFAASTLPPAGLTGAFRTTGVARGGLHSSALPRCAPVTGLRVSAGSQGSAYRERPSLTGWHGSLPTCTPVTAWRASAAMPTSRGLADVAALPHVGLAQSRFERAARQLKSAQVSRLMKAVRDWSDTSHWVSTPFVPFNAPRLESWTTDGRMSRLSLETELESHLGFYGWLIEGRGSRLGPRGPRYWFERWRRDLLAGFAALAPCILVALLRGVARGCRRALVWLGASMRIVGARLERLVDTIVPHGPPIPSGYLSFSSSEVGREP